MSSQFVGVLFVRAPMAERLIEIIIMICRAGRLDWNGEVAAMQ